jgi:hypothetical protein
MIGRVAEAILFAIALKFALLPLAGWGTSLLALRKVPSGARSVVGVISCLIGALATVYFAYVFSLGPIANGVIGVATLALVTAHIVRYASARRLRRPPGSPPPASSSWLRRLWRYL